MNTKIINKLLKVADSLKSADALDIPTNVDKITYNQYGKIQEKLRAFSLPKLRRYQKTLNIQIEDAYDEDNKVALESLDIMLKQVDQEIMKREAEEVVK